MLCALSNHRRHFRIIQLKMAGFVLWVFSWFVRFLLKKNDINSDKYIATVRSINHNVGTLKELQLSDVNINTGAQSINTLSRESFWWRGVGMGWGERKSLDVKKSRLFWRSTLVESTWLIAYLPTGRSGGGCDKINILLASHLTVTRKMSYKFYSIG